MRTFAADYARGIESESKTKSAIETITGCGMIKSPKTNSRFDFSNEEKTIYAELKTRFMNHDKYTTTLITASKVDLCDKDTSKVYYFVFAFDDGVYYLKYDKEVFSKFECKEFCRIRRADYNDTPKLHYFIPYTSLTKL
jgi:hypothetical protein